MSNQVDPVNRENLYRYFYKEQMLQIVLQPAKKCQRQCNCQKHQKNQKFSKQLVYCIVSTIWTKKDLLVVATLQLIILTENLIKILLGVRKAFHGACHQGIFLKMIKMQGLEWQIRTIKCYSPESKGLRWCSPSEPSR